MSSIVSPDAHRSSKSYSIAFSTLKKSHVSLKDMALFLFLRQLPELQGRHSCIHDDESFSTKKTLKAKKGILALENSGTKNPSSVRT